MHIDLLIFLSYFSILLLSSGYGIFHFRKMPAWLRTVAFLCLSTLISETISLILAYTIANSCPPYHLHVWFSYLLLCRAYTQLHRDNRFIRLYSMVSATILFSFSIINSIFIQSPLTFPSYPIVLSSIFTLVLTLSSFTLMLKQAGKMQFLRESAFWFNTANLLLYTTSFPYWAFYNILTKTDDMPVLFENLIAVFTILLYFLYGISLYLGSKPVYSDETRHGK